MRQKKPPVQTCGNCKHWDIDKAKDAAGRVSANRVAPCLYPIPPMPESARQYTHIQTAFMCKTYGTRCPVWEERKP